MLKDNLQRRTLLAKKFLADLKKIYDKMKQSSSDVTQYSRNLFEKLHNENKREIQIKIDKYNSNIQKIKQLNCDITLKINSWYEFIKDENEIKKVTFPIKLYFRKKNLKSFINSANLDISNIVIENRFIKEQIVIWEQKLGLKSIQQVKKWSNFKDYEELINKKDLLVSELQYLLPSIPGICPVRISVEDIDSLMQRLSMLASP